MGPVDRSAFIAIPNIPSNTPRRYWRCGGIPLKETFRSARAGLAAGDRYSPDFDHQLARISRELPPVRLGGAIWILYLGGIIDGLAAGNQSTLFA